MKLDQTAMNREIYFPTCIYSFEIPDAETVNRRLLALIRAEQERDSEGIQRSNFKSLGGWHSHNDLHKESDYADLVEAIHSAAALASNDLGYHRGYALRIGTMWSIINVPGSSNRSHIHPGCMWSGVYYVQAPENSGNIDFVDPRTENLIHQPKYRPNKRRPRRCWTKVNVSPKAGKMLIFPSWLYHSVAPNLSEADGQAAERIIISFNLSQRKIPRSKNQPVADNDDAIQRLAS